MTLEHFRGVCTSAPLLLAACAGCGGPSLPMDPSWLQASDDGRPGAVEAIGRLNSTDALDSLMEGTATQADAAAPESPPATYPTRTNPFEFATSVDLEAAAKETASGSDIKLFGFIGNEDLKVIVSVDGETRVMAVGDRSPTGLVEVLEIDPPEVVLEVAGLRTVYSLLGRTAERSER